MPDRTKLATCCYCGTRTMLVPSARDGHELACAACGAPLHEMKWLKAPEKPAKRKKTAQTHRTPHPKHATRPRKAKRRKRKSPWNKIFDEAFDVLEDIFD